MENIRKLFAETLKEVAKNNDVQIVEYSQKTIILLVKNDEKSFFVQIFPVNRKVGG